MHIGAVRAQSDAGCTANHPLRRIEVPFFRTHCSAPRCACILLFRRFQLRALSGQIELVVRPSEFLPLWAVLCLVNSKQARWLEPKQS